jgi:hypothetical protein
LEWLTSQAHLAWLAANWFQAVCFGLAAVIVVVVLFQYVLSERKPRATLVAKADSSDWQRVEWAGPNNYPGATKLFVSDAAPVQTIEIAPSNFQEISWGGVSMRLTYTAQYRKGNDDLAVQLRIEAKNGLLPSMPINGGPQVEVFGQNLYRLPAGSADTAGARSVYYHYMTSGSYTMFALYVDHVNTQNGLLRLSGLFASWSQPVDYGKAL